jgi:hypothetical protein
MSDRHPVLRDGDLDRVLERRGAVTCPWLGAEARVALDAAVDALGLDGSSGFHDTAAAGLGFEERQAVHELLVDSFAEPARRVLADYQPVMSAVMTKWPGPGGEKTIHRDFQLVDERRFRTVCVWVPLGDVDGDNGALRVLPGSHLVPTGIRSVPRTPEHPPDPLRALTMADLDAVPVAAGDAVVFDLAVVHGSDVNRTDVPRRAVGVAYAPAAAELSLRYVHDDGRVELLHVDDPDVFRRIDWGRRPTELRRDGDVAPHVETVVRDELIRRSRLVAGG